MVGVIAPRAMLPHPYPAPLSHTVLAWFVVSARLVMQSPVRPARFVVLLLLLAVAIRHSSLATCCVDVPLTELIPPLFHLLP